MKISEPERSCKARVVTIDGSPKGFWSALKLLHLVCRGGQSILLAARSPRSIVSYRSSGSRNLKQRCSPRRHSLACSKSTRLSPESHIRKTSTNQNIPVNHPFLHLLESYETHK